MAGRRSTCPTLPVQKTADNHDQQPTGHFTSLQNIFWRRHSAPVARVAASRVHNSSMIADRDPTPDEPAEKQSQLSSRRRRRPPVPTPRMRLLSIEQGRQLEESTIGEQGTRDIPEAVPRNVRCGTIVSWPNVDASRCNMRPTVKPRKLKPMQLSRLEAVPSNTICPVPAIGDHQHPLHPGFAGKNDVFSAPLPLSPLADEFDGHKRNGMAMMKNNGQSFNVGQPQNYERIDKSDKKVMWPPSNMEQFTPSQCDLPENSSSPGKKVREDTSTTSDTTLLPRTKHYTLLILSLAAVFILCLWTFYSSKNFILFHGARSLGRDPVGMEDLTIAAESNEMAFKNVGRTTAESGVKLSSDDYSTEDQLEALHLNNTFSEDGVI